MHFTTFAISARREDTSFTHCLSFRPGVTGTPLAPPEQAPNGVLLTTGSVAQSPGVPCPRLTPKLSVVFRSLDPKVTCVNNNHHHTRHLTSFGRSAARNQSNPHDEDARQMMERVQGDVKDVMLIEALGLYPVETIKGCKRIN